MNERTDEPGCDVVALVPHPYDSALVLCVDPPHEHEGAVLLPGIRTGPEPGIDELVRGLGEHLQSAVIPLRANALTWHENFDAASMIAEFEPVSAQPPEGFCWRHVDESTIDSVSPEWARASVAAWLLERSRGWSDLRPQWSRPGWLDQAGSWMREQMDLAGFVDPQTPRVHHLWGVSVVLCAESSIGTAYLKCSGERFRHEAIVTQALAEHSPSLLPTVVAVEPERGWLLMRDLGAPLLGDQAESSWVLGLEALVRLQQTWLGRSQELLALGAEDRPLSSVATWIAETVEDVELLSHLTPDERRTWLGTVPSMVESCQRLADLAPGVSLVHGDFHPWNVVSGADSVRIFDWTDASVTHPFLDLVTYIMRTTEKVRRESMLQRYLDGWSGYLPNRALPEVGRLALVVGALHQAHTYAGLIPTVMPDDLGQLRGGDAHWLRRAMRYADQGLESMY